MLNIKNISLIVFVSSCVLLLAGCGPLKSLSPAAIEAQNLGLREGSDYEILDNGSVYIKPQAAARIRNRVKS